MPFEPIRTNERMGQWNRWDVYAQTAKPAHHQRRMTRQFHHGNVMLAKPAQHRLIGSVFATSHKDAVRLARRAVAGFPQEAVRAAKVAKLTARPLSASEYERWIEEAARRSPHPRFGPLVDESGHAVACFVPR